MHGRLQQEQQRWVTLLCSLAISVTLGDLCRISNRILILHRLVSKLLKLLAKAP